MTPQFEQVTIPSGHSWGLLWREVAQLPFLWHYHPQFELTLTINARGQRYIGDHLADFGPGDLVLVGPNLPHTWSASERIDPGQPMLAVVIWFSLEWLEQLGSVFPELRALQQLGQRAGQGLHFTPQVAARCLPLMLRLQELAPAQRLPVLLEVLLHLAQDHAAARLAAHALTVADAQQGRMARVLDYMHAHFREDIPLVLLASQAALSVGAFHRFFKRHVLTTPSTYLAQLRIGRACQQLIETEKSVAVIAAESGYRNLAHFNRQFKLAKAVAPRAFRRLYRAGEQ